jgi:hypothetical protein
MLRPDSKHQLIMDNGTFEDKGARAALKSLFARAEQMKESAAEREDASEPREAQITSVGAEQVVLHPEGMQRLNVGAAHSDSKANIHNATEPAASPVPTVANLPADDDETTEEQTETSGIEAQDVVIEPVKSLREHGLLVETINHFAIKEYLKAGVLFPGRHSDDSPAKDIFLGTEVGKPSYALFGDDKKYAAAIYNQNALADEERVAYGVFIVGTAWDVWVMHQNGFAAVSFFDDECGPQVLKQHLVGHRITDVKVALDNNAQGRLDAIWLREVFAKYEIAVHICILPVRLDCGVRDLFRDLKFDRKAFRDTVGTLPLAPSFFVSRWNENPALDLPEATAEDDLLPCLNEASLQGLPLPACVVDGVLLAGRPALFTGKHDLGKSAVALDMSLSVCTGRKWNGKKTLQGDVFYIAAEGASGIAKRVQAWKEHYGIVSVPNFHVVPRALPLQDAEERERLIRTVKAHSDSPALIVADTLARCCGEADDNSTADMNAFTSSIEELCLATGAAVLIVHHNNRSDSYRGSSALPANCDGHLTLSGDSGGAKVTLKVAKLKDFADGEKMVLRREVVTLKGSVDEHGHPQSSVVFVKDDSEAKGTASLSPKEEATLQALAALHAQDTTHPGFTSTEWLKAAKLAGVSKPTYDRARKKLVDLGAVGHDSISGVYTVNDKVDDADAEAGDDETADDEVGS